MFGLPSLWHQLAHCFVAGTEPPHSAPLWQPCAKGSPLSTTAHWNTVTNMAISAIIMAKDFSPFVKQNSCAFGIWLLGISEVLNGLHSSYHIRCVGWSSSLKQTLHYIEMPHERSHMKRGQTRLKDKNMHFRTFNGSVIHQWINQKITCNLI